MRTILNDDMRAFVTGGVSIMVASRNAQLIPSIARAKGCAVVTGGAMRARESPVDTRATPKLRLFVSVAQAPDLVDDVRTSHAISVTFSAPATHQSLQLKGHDATVTAVTDTERGIIAAYVERFAGSIAPMGFTDEFTHTFFASPDDEIAIEFTPTESFEQTPGPAAGTRLG